MGGGNSKANAGVRVVVVGANLGGTEAAMLLEKKGFRVTVIEPKDRLYVNFASIRAAVVENFEENIFVPYDKLFKDPNNKIIRAFATGVDTVERKVAYQALDSEGKPAGQPASVAYDFCIICTGSTYGFPMKPAASTGETRAALASIRGAVKTADNIVLIGGGATGIELAGEIKEVYPNKRASIAHAGAALLSDPAQKFKPAFQERMAKECGLAGIKLHLGAKIVGLDKLAEQPGVSTVVPGIYAGKQELKTTAGATIPADLVIVTTGVTPCTGWLKGGQLENALGPRGIKTELTYQVKGHSRIFAFGDCADTPDAKAGWLLGGQAGVIVKNIIKLVGVKGDLETATVKLAQGKPEGTNGIALIPVGMKHGAAALPFGIVGWMTKMKSGDLFTAAVASKMRLTPAQVQAANKGLKYQV